MTRKITFPDGESIPILGQGTWHMGDSDGNRKEEIRALQTGIDAGLKAIDTAEMYGDGRSEKLVGEAIAGRRDQVFLISKVLPSNADREGTKSACERSLKRLKTGTLDLYLLHWKGEYPFAETVEAMNELVVEGKIRRWGVSNMDVSDMEAIVSLPEGGGCAANEVLYNLSRRGIEYDLLGWCAEHGMPVIAYSPVEQGRILDNPALLRVAERHGATPAQIALAWVLRRSNVLAIPKAATVEHVNQNTQALSLALSPQDVVDLDEAFPPPGWKTELEML